MALVANFKHFCGTEIAGDNKMMLSAYNTQPKNVRLMLHPIPEALGSIIKKFF
jgi:hypothetical protein